MMFVLNFARTVGTNVQSGVAMPKSLGKLFTTHPHSVGETYGDHFLVAMSYAGRLFCASCAAFLHALLPFLCVTTASRSIQAMHDEMSRRSPNSNA
jgi:hypothetical protein